MRTQTGRFLWIAAVLLTTLACQLAAQSNGAKLASTTAVAEPTNTATVAEPAAASSAAKSGATSDSQSEPVAPNAKNPPDAKLEWFLQDTSNPQIVYYSITYTSRETSHAQFASGFRIRAYADSGNILDEDHVLSGWILPGQSLRTAGLLLLETGGRVARLEVTAEEPGRLAAIPEGNGGSLSTGSASFLTINRTPYVIGTIRNDFDRTLMGVDVTALAYDANGQVEDAATEQVRFIPAGQQVAVQVPLHVSKTPARVELFPSLGNLVEFVEAQVPPIIVEKVGALRISDGQVQTIFVLKNNAARAYAASPYIASLYDAQGKAVAAGNGEIAFMSPESRVAQTTYISYPAGAKVARVDVQVRPRPDNDWANQEAVGITSYPLMVKQVQYQPSVDQRDDKVVALISNPSDQRADSAGVTAVLYNAAGEIVGGGETGIGVLPAGGQTQAEIRVNVKGDVAQVEVIAFFYNTPAAPNGSNTQPVSPGDGQEALLPNVEAPEILSQWFAPNDWNQALIDFAFLIENPNPSLELHDIEYQAVAYDNAGLIVGSISGGHIDLLPAVGRFGVVNTLSIDGTAAPARMEIIITGPGQPQAPTSSQPPFQDGPANFTHHQEWDSVSGLVNNPLSQEVTGVKINALVFDTDGQIVGAGSSFDEYFVPASSQVPVVVRVASSTMADRAELYPFFTPMDSGPLAPTGLQPLQVVATGFVQNPQSPASVTVAFVVRNPNPDQAISVANYQVTLYDQAGALLATMASDLEPLFRVYPGDTTAAVAVLNVPDETRVARSDVLLGQGQAKKVTGESPLHCSEAIYIAEPFPKVTGLIVNSSEEAIDQVKVFAVLYDNGNHIIGGGSTSLSGVPADGQAPVEIMVSSVTAPARVEIYADKDTFGMHP